MPRKNRDSSIRIIGYTYKCKQCGVTYHPKHKSFNSYCSRECSFIGRKKIWGEYCKLVEPKYSSVYQRECDRCGRAYYGRTGKPKKMDRCKSCGTTQIPLKKICVWCKAEYKPSNIGQAHCSDQCKGEAKIESKRAGKAKRRALEKGTRVETVRPFDVFDRDGWKCKACGCETPRELRSTYDDSAPELDHVIPLSKGGDHSMKNTQCLCRLCNQMKRDMSMREYVVSIGNPLFIGDGIKNPLFTTV